MQPVLPPATACGRDARRPLHGRRGWRRGGSRAGTGLGTGRQRHAAGTAPAAGPGSRARRLRARLLHGWLVAPLAMMPGQIPDPSVTAGSLPGLGPLTGLPSSALTAEELKYADIRNIGAMIAPLHFLEVKLGKRPQPVKSELDEEEERRKRRREKNKVAAARCRNKKKERTEFLQRESERLELMNAELKTQIEELKQERQQLILMLNRHRPTCIVRTDSVKTPESEGNPLLEQLEKK
ncbi:jun dimerization protein 2 isoform X2 [Cavia porcellus]|uniref:jun dimerization protein 2 isoform X2 n=1 Tax=Cavia porcellus TaxID=10141 RepID=UPI002FE361BF